MQSRTLLLLTPFVPLGFGISRYLKALAPKTPEPANYREQANRLSELAAGIHTATDARLFVDFVADIFSEQLPPTWAGAVMREKVAQREFAAVSNPQQLISEQRVSEAWNSYVQTIGARQDCQIDAQEVHNLRDAFLTLANLYWAKGSHTIWTVPTIYATRDDGALAEGCRAIESIRIFWDIANIPENLAAARVRVSQGILASNIVRPAQNLTSEPTHGGHVSIKVGAPSPLEIAERAFVAKKGTRAFGRAVNEMLDYAFA